MEKGLSSNTIPSILLDLFSLHIVLGLFYNISSFFSRCYTFCHKQFPMFGIVEMKQEVKKELISSRESSSSSFDDEECLSGKDIHMIMEKLGLEHSLEGEDEGQKRWGCNEIQGIFEEEPSIQEVKEAFDVFDENKDGFIDAWELQRVLCVLGLRQGKDLKACSKMISKFDEDNDEKIDFNDFINLMVKSF